MFKFDTASNVITARGAVGFEDGFTADQFLDALHQMTGDIVINLQSEGGAIDEGLSIYNMLSDYDGRVVINVDSVAASIATVIMMAGDYVTARQNATIMVHDPWVMAMGNAREFRGLSDILDMMGRQIAEVYAEKTGGTPEDWLGIMAKETYMSAADAAKLGMLDEVITNKGKTKASKQPAGVKPIAVCMAPRRAKLLADNQARKLRMRAIGFDDLPVPE